VGWHVTEIAINYAPRRRIFVFAKIWWTAVRPFSFPVSIVPAAMGVALAWTQGYAIDAGLAVLTFLGAVAAHAGANLLQDYFDYTGGIDKPGTQGGSGILVSGLLNPRAVFMGAIVAFATAALIAVPLLLHAGATLVWIVVAGFVLGAGYAVPRIGFKYRMLGDVAVFLAFGVGITLGSFVIQTGTLAVAPLACAIPFGFLVVAILHANNMRDAKDDLEAGVCTLAAALGARASRGLYAVVVLAAFAVPVAYVQMKFLNAGALFIVATVPSACKLILDVWCSAYDDRAVLTRAVEGTAKLSLIYGISMIMGMVIWTVVLGR